nr:hypothetical protein [Tanacetum cinerariifolium]
MYGDHDVSCGGVIGIKHRHNASFSWDSGFDVCVDLTGSSPLTRTGMADFVSGRAVINVAQRKRGIMAIMTGATGWGGLMTKRGVKGNFLSEERCVLKDVWTSWGLVKIVPFREKGESNPTRSNLCLENCSRDLCDDKVNSGLKCPPARCNSEDCVSYCGSSENAHLVLRLYGYYIFSQSWMSFKIEKTVVFCTTADKCY